jgi:hypothetical protein
MKSDHSPLNTLHPSWLSEVGQRRNTHIRYLVLFVADQQGIIAPCILVLAPRAEGIETTAIVARGIERLLALLGTRAL